MATVTRNGQSGYGNWWRTDAARKAIPFFVVVAAVMLAWTLVELGVDRDLVTTFLLGVTVPTVVFGTAFAFGPYTDWSDEDLDRRPEAGWTFWERLATRVAPQRKP